MLHFRILILLLMSFYGLICNHQQKYYPKTSQKLKKTFLSQTQIFHQQLQIQRIPQQATQLSTNYKARTLQIDCNIANCQKCLTTSTCQDCKETYFVFDNNSVDQCRPCIQNCQTCIDSKSCQLCASNFYKTTDSSSCLPCNITNCQQCQNNNQCTTCSIGYSWVTDKCKLCSESIAQCQECLNDGKICSICVSGFYWSGDACKPCDVENCYLCEMVNQCIDCLSGFYFEQNKCKPCSGIPHCLICFQGDSCDICENGFTIGITNNISNGRCQNCKISNCLTCSLNNICIECSPNFQVTKEGQCNFNQNFPLGVPLFVILLSIFFGIGILVFLSVVIYCSQAQTAQQQKNNHHHTEDHIPTDYIDTSKHL